MRSRTSMPRGKRRLPIHDPAHVRNALARFSQVQFDTDHDRERARMRLLNAAKKFKIVPIGFIAGQLQSERAIDPRPEQLPQLPTGFIRITKPNSVWVIIMNPASSSRRTCRRLRNGTCWRPKAGMPGRNLPSAHSMKPAQASNSRSKKRPSGMKNAPRAMSPIASSILAGCMVPEQSTRARSGGGL